MAINKYDDPSVYLMSRLYDHQGEVCKNAKFAPLPFQTLFLPNKNDKDGVRQNAVKENSYNGKGNAIYRVKDKNSIATTDEVGRVLFFSSDNINENVSLISLPTSSQKYSSERFSKMKFFPSQLVPLYLLSYGQDWLSHLSGKLSVLDESHEINILPKRIRLPEGKSQLIGKFINADFGYEKAYNDWYDQEITGSIKVVEIPKFYTIVLTFGSEYFDGALVQISDFPSFMKISGSKTGQSSRPVSQVKVLNTSKNNDSRRICTATFWIENEFDPDEVFDKYARFDISFNESFSPELRRTLSNKGLDIRKGYSIKEKVFDLPIRTAFGKSALINGEPISVEEALLNHVPEYFQELISRLTDDKNDLNDDLEVKKSQDSDIAKSILNHWSTYKGQYQNIIGNCTSQTAWNIKSKLVFSSLSMLKSEDDTLYRSMVAIAGVGNSIHSIIDAAKNENLKNTSYLHVRKIHHLLDDPQIVPLVVKDKFKDVFQPLGEKVKGYITVPEKLKPYLIGEHSFLSKANGFLKKSADGANAIHGVVDKSMTIGTAIYNFNDTLKKQDEVKKNNSSLELKVEEYIYKVLSASTNQLTDINDINSEKIDKHLENIDKINNSVRGLGTDSNYFETDEGSSELSVKLISTRFNFDSDTIILSDKEVVRGLLELSDLLSKLPDTIMINVAGYTCNTGTEAYNLDLSIRRANAVRDYLLEK
ncbi:OmpA family protein [Photobacterium sp. 1_MG-2023]|uniref:OmpA family protein n=1 Tax=Photobacterium sp. 1_MG-2023 TaxID=3062646 RepID=UPI0026E1D8A9|nr:OmpA family protein [Photobacterium sp. 1_MG-2023]MDO6706080.1 OmpA family protein [Photobacterium sp. 1_MG-2023]